MRTFLCSSLFHISWEATRNKCIASSNRCLTSSNKCLRCRTVVSPNQPSPTSSPCRPTKQPSVPASGAVEEAKGLREIHGLGSLCSLGSGKTQKNHEELLLGGKSGLSKGWTMPASQSVFAFGEQNKNTTDHYRPLMDSTHTVSLQFPADSVGRAAALTTHTDCLARSSVVRRWQTIGDGFEDVAVCVFDVPFDLKGHCITDSPFSRSPSICFHSLERATGVICPNTTCSTSGALSLSLVPSGPWGRFRNALHGRRSISIYHDLHEKPIASRLDVQGET